MLRTHERSRFPHRESDCAAIATIPQGSPEAINRKSYHQPARQLSEAEIRIAKRSIGFRMTDAVLLHLCSFADGDLRPTLLSVDGELINRAAAIGCACLDYRDWQ
ncbi:MAG: hypothetical protein PGN34_17045 [Methylobacterium frigidaeris]